MFKTILVATDGSDHAGRAVDVAGDLAAKYGARLVVLHVVMHGRPLEEIRHLAEVEFNLTLPPPPPAPAGLSGTGAAMVDDSKAIQTLYRVIGAVGKRIAEDAAAAAKAKGAADVATLIEDGDVVDRILACAGREKADVIVMGRRGLGGLADLLLGSNSHKVSQLADCTCITVK